MSVVEFIKEKLMIENQKYINNSTDHFNFWEQHIRFVVKEALLLADQYGADKEVVELAALLHDVASIMQVGTRTEHHINGQHIAEAWLREYGYPENQVRRVSQCILHHRSSRYAENIEELCVADADIIAHYDNIPMCFHVAFKYNKIKTNSASEWITYFESDWHDLSEQTKQIFKPRYDRIMDVLFGAMFDGTTHDDQSST